MTEPEIRICCSWCGIHIRGSLDAPHVSHGICERCYNQELNALQDQRNNLGLVSPKKESDPNVDLGGEG